MRTLRLLIVLTGLAVSVWPAGAAEEGFDYVFVAPGARSTGFAGAFVAVADDATAAFANPAGLVQLVRPEISVELRSSINDTAQDGDEFSADFTGLGFVSAVLPVGRWTLAAYGHSIEKGTLQSDANSDELSEGLSLRRWAAAAAFRLGDTLSLGAGVSYFEGDISSAAIDGNGGDDFGLNAGVLWSPTPWLNVGAAYREAPEIAFRSTGSTTDDLRLALPSVASLGVALRPAKGRWTIGVEWDRVGESSLIVLDEGAPQTLDAGSGDEYHLGVEYVTLEMRPVLALRGGAWRQAERDVGVARDALPDDVAVNDDMHYAGGFGLAWSRVQLDVGVDHSEPETTLSVSVIVSLGPARTGQRPRASAAFPGASLPSAVR